MSIWWSTGATENYLTSTPPPPHPIPSPFVAAPVLPLPRSGASYVTCVGDNARVLNPRTGTRDLDPVLSGLQTQRDEDVGPALGAGRGSAAGQRGYECSVRGWGGRAAGYGRSARGRGGWAAGYERSVRGRDGRAAGRERSVRGWAAGRQAMNSRCGAGRQGGRL